MKTNRLAALALIEVSRGLAQSLGLVLRRDDVVAPEGGGGIRSDVRGRGELVEIRSSTLDGVARKVTITHGQLDRGAIHRDDGGPCWPGLDLHADIPRGALGDDRRPARNVRRESASP